MHLKQNFPKASDTNIKEGIAHPQMLNTMIEWLLNSRVYGYKIETGSHNVENYRDIVNDLIAFYNLDCTSFPSFHLGFIPENLDAVSDEYEKHFLQEISANSFIIP